MGRNGTGVKAASKTSIEITFQYQGKRCRERIKLEPTAANLKRCERQKAAIELAIEQGTFDYAVTFPHSPKRSEFSERPGDDLLTEDYLKSWWREEEKYLKASTAMSDGGIVYNKLIPEFGHLSLTALTWSHIKQWIRSHNWSRKTENNVLSVFRRALNDALENELIDHHPMVERNIRRRKARGSTASTSDEIDPFSHEERTALIGAATGQLKNLVQFGFWTGMRLSELFALNWDNVDYENGRIHVCGAITRYSKGIESTKTEAGERYVELLPAALSALKDQEQYTCDNGEEIFQNGFTGKRWVSDEVLRKGQWTTLCRRAGVRYRPPGQLRHTFASMTLMAGEAPQWVARQLGHTDWTFTAKVYYRWIPADKGDAGKKVVEKWGENE